MQCEITPVGVQVGVERGESQTAGTLQRNDLEAPARVRRGQSALPAPLQRDPLPGKIRARSHCGGVQAVGDIGCLAVEIEASRDVSLQLSCLSADFHMFGTALPGESCYERECAQIRVMQQVSERATRRLIELHTGIHTIGIETQRELVIATLAIRAPRRDARVRVLQRYQVR